VFSVVMTQLKALLTRNGRAPTVTCFVSYPWGDRETETWVRNVLAADLRQAGVDVWLDVRSNRIGDSLARFVERIEAVDFVVVVGTPDYLQKYVNAEGEGAVVAAEADLINQRLLGPEPGKTTVLPVLRRGTAAESLPPLMRTRLCADFREEAGYFAQVYDLILALHRVDMDEEIVQEHRTELAAAAEPGKPAPRWGT